MITELRWNTRDDNQAAWTFFAQHPRGVKALEVQTSPGVAPKYEGDPGIPGGREYLHVITGDGSHRWCTPGGLWTWDGMQFRAVREKASA